jgi:hypothetical protein
MELLSMRVDGKVALVMGAGSGLGRPLPSPWLKRGRHGSKAGLLGNTGDRQGCDRFAQQLAQKRTLPNRDAG